MRDDHIEDRGGRARGDEALPESVVVQEARDPGERAHVGLQAIVRDDHEDDDARRKYYRLTPLGRRVLAAETERLEDLVRAIRAKRGLPERKAES